MSEWESKAAAPPAKASAGHPPQHAMPKPKVATPPTVAEQYDVQSAIIEAVYVMDSSTGNRPRDVHTTYLRTLWKLYAALSGEQDGKTLSEAKRNALFQEVRRDSSRRSDRAVRHDAGGQGISRRTRLQREVRRQLVVVAARRGQGARRHCGAGRGDARDRGAPRRRSARAGTACASRGASAS